MVRSAWMECFVKSRRDETAIGFESSSSVMEVIMLVERLSFGIIHWQSGLVNYYGFAPEAIHWRTRSMSSASGIFPSGGICSS